MSAVSLVQSSIVHVRHGSPSHRLERKGLSIWIDLDDLDGAARQSALFSVGRFNLLSFHPKDYGVNFNSRSAPQDLAAYARGIAAEVIPGQSVDQVMLLTFPRILGVSFNPISVYLCRAQGQDVLAIYEVRNTFGDMHSYVGRMNGDSATVHEVDKNLHVSPFFSMDGQYRLKINASAAAMALIIQYSHQTTLRLTATLRGVVAPLTTSSLLSAMVATRQFPLRPLIAIHIEAAKLWFKKVRFFGRPDPAASRWTITQTTKDNTP
ncbi:MAG: DUF1365 domain-containing protein [Alphaproteobacteria bacterium]|nr:DUF1365 domain-containing protein [Alphaproteobacteria bacterium]